MKVDDGLDFALSRDSGRMVDVTQVVNGLACRCVCSGCGSRLVAKKGRKYRHHFAHYGAHGVIPTCSTGRESSLHCAARQLIADWTSIELPPLRLEEAGREAIIPGKTMVIVRAELPDEKGRRGSWSAQGFRPDVILHGSNEQAWCEVRVTHAVDERKRAKLSRANVATLEFDLSGLYRTGCYTLATLDELLRNDLTFRHWVFHPDEDEMRRRLRGPKQRESGSFDPRLSTPFGYGPPDDAERIGLHRFGFKKLVHHPALGLIPIDPAERLEYLARAYPEASKFRLSHATAYLRHHPHGDSTCLVTFAEGRGGDDDALLSEYAKSEGLRCWYFGAEDALQVSGARCFEKLERFFLSLGGSVTKRTRSPSPMSTM